MGAMALSRRGIYASIALVALQAICTVFFMSDFLSEVLGLRHWAIPWQWREVLQVMASLGLTLGSVAGAFLMRAALRHARLLQRRLRAASGAFFETVAECFEEWGLSPSERDVALFAVRGYSNTEIAALRGTSEATIKSQMNAVFRKSRTANRAQLISQFVDILMEAETPEAVRPSQGQGFAPGARS